MSPRIQPVLAATAFVLAVGVPAARAGTVTYGSDLTAPATIVEAHQADAAFWPSSARGQAIGAPEAGQVTTLRLKGTVLQERGAHTPLNEIHFQHLIPHADGSVTESQTTAPMDVPYSGDPNQITEYAPENLCVGQGDVIDFNDEGGWAYNGTGNAPDYDHYKAGAPFQVFGAVPTSSTAWFSKDGATFGGMTWSPTAPLGGVKTGQELLLQVVLATGNDIGTACRNFLHLPPATTSPSPPTSAATPSTPAASVRIMKIRAQTNHVSRKRAVGPMIYCPGKGPACTGTGTLRYRGKVIASGRLRGAGPKTLRVPMKLSAKAYRLLRKRHTLRVSFRVVSSLGTYTRAIRLRS